MPRTANPAMTREKIKQYYFLWGWSMKEIGTALGITPKAVWGHIEKIRIAERKKAEMLKELYEDKFNQQWIVDETYRDIMKRANNEYVLARDTKGKMACLNTVMQAMNSKIGHLQSIGRIPKVSDKDRPDSTVIYHSLLGGGEIRVEAKQEAEKIKEEKNEG